MRKKILAPLLLTLFISSQSHQGFGQVIETKNRSYQKHPIDFAIGNFSVGIPFSNVFIGKIYPMATLGTEFYYRNKNHSQVYQTAKIGGYYNRYNTSAVLVNSEIGYRYTFNFGLFADAAIGVGYAHLFRPNALYKSTGDSEYESISDTGKPSVLADFTVAIGYDFTRQFQKPVSLFIRYGNYVQLAYNADIPALTQNSFQIGTRFFIHTKK